MRILITGASGFLGRAAINAFHTAGWKVRACSRFPVYNSAAELVRIPDNLASTDWSAILKNVDVVLHLAGIAHSPGTLPDEYHNVNVTGTSQLVKCALKSSVSHFIFVSSIAVYGRHHQIAITENTSFSPENSYARSKLDAELALQNIASNTPLSWSIIRPPMVYGPNAPGNFNRLIKLTRTGIPLPLSGAISLRSYIGIENLVSSLIAIANHPNAFNKSYVVSDNDDISTVNLIRLIAEIQGTNTSLWNVPKRLLSFAGAISGYSQEIDRLFDPLIINSGRIREELSWTPPRSLEDGLRHAIIM